MMVNSKLAPHEKVLRKGYLADLDILGGLVFSFPQYAATVAIMPEFPNSRMMLVSVSMAETREKRFKRKVGEFHALNKMFNECEYIKLPTVFNIFDEGDTIENMAEYQKEWAENFAASFVL